MTEVRIDKFKGADIFAVWDTDNETQYPVISFGLKKAKVIAEHYEELLEFIQTQEAKAKMETKAKDKANTKMGEIKKKPASAKRGTITMKKKPT